MTDPISIPRLPDIAAPLANEAPQGLRGQIFQLIKAENLPVTIDEEGDLEVELQGQKLFVQCLEYEITILRIFGQWDVSTAPGSELDKLRACNQVHSQLTVAKTTLQDDILIVAAEHILGGTLGETKASAISSAEGLAVLVYSSLELVLTALGLWNQTLTEE